MAPLDRPCIWAAASLALLSTSKGQARQLYARALDGPEELKESYDYVIIGGGTAGLTVADRLSEDEDTTVLVIENGALLDHDEDIDSVRDRISWLGGDPSIYYIFYSAPNKELNNRQTILNLGNVVGGSSAVNGMQAPRGTSEDYDRWGSHFGPNSSWSWEGILPYFKKGLHFQEPSKEAQQAMPYWKSDISYWGTLESTKVYTGWPTFQYPGIKYQFEAFAQVPEVEFPDDSGAGHAGVYWFPTLMDGAGTVNRSYAKTGHWDGLDRSNYHLLPNSKVIKIEIEGNKATAATFRPRNTTASSGLSTTIRADKEVILAAGTMHSPLILQWSGIGPRGLLESAGIETKVNLPGVGQNFHDHNILNMTYDFRNFSVRPNRRDDFVAQNPEFFAWADELWNKNRTGPWSRANFNAAAWLPLPVVAPDEYESLARKVDEQSAADYLPKDSDPTVVVGYQARLDRLSKAMRSMNTIYYQQAFTGDAPNNYITFEHPLSVGSINMNVTAPDSIPVVNYRTYSNPVDFEIMLALAQFNRRLNLEYPVYTPFEPVELRPGLNVSTVDQWMEYMREATFPTGQHPVGTCSMLPLELGGVVDEDLRVYGVEDLRVVDASTMNLVVGVNTCQSVYAMAEKAADHIKGLVH